VPGDPIVGYISRGRGVIVHRADCANVKQFAPARLVNVSWAGDENVVYPATIKLLCTNKKGVMAEIAGLLSNEDVNIESGTFSSAVDGRTQIILNIEVNDSAHLYRTIEKLSQLEHVQEAVRTSSKEARAAE
jgi:GTP pyrophosphokinase